MSSRNVGLIGLHASGKTTLLTALVAHLKYHNPSRFPIGRDGKAKITEFNTPPLPDKDGWSSFRYQRYLSQLSEGQRWPEKTTDREKLVCEFRHSEDLFGRRTLEFYDIPGERFADMPMLNWNFKTWSFNTWGNINTIALSDAFGEFITAVKAGGDRPEDLVAAYKLGLARTLGFDRSAITPSTFLLDLDGNLCADRNENGDEIPPEDIVEGRFSGLPNVEFVPLPPEFQKRWSPAVTAEFTKAYDGYKKDVIQPIFQAIHKCESLLVMVDVLTLLEYGNGMYSDTSKQMRAGLPGLKSGNLLPSFLGMGGVKKIAFVIPKVDLVHPDDRDRLEKLGRTLADGVIADLKGIETTFLLCSSVYSSIDPIKIRRAESAKIAQVVRAGENGDSHHDDVEEEENGETTRIYYKVRKEVEPKPGMYARRKQFREVTEAMEVSRIPADWQQGLSRGGAYLPPIPPSTSIAENDPPDHYNLDGVFRFLTE